MSETDLETLCVLCDRACTIGTDGIDVNGKPFHRTCLAGLAPLASAAETVPHTLGCVAESAHNADNRDEEAPPLCHRCHKAVHGPLLQAMGQPWHSDCFTCSHCQKPFEQNRFVAHRGDPWCESCVKKEEDARKEAESEVSEPAVKELCAGCNRVIEGPHLSALKKKWHQDCFKCVKCGAVVASEKFLSVDGQPMCKRCGERPEATEGKPPPGSGEYARKAEVRMCCGCNTKITGEYVRALNREWHLDCFVCTKCNCSLGEQPHGEFDGKPYCKTHYEEVFLAVCAGCGKPIKYQVLSALDKKWHPSCFVCTTCKQPFGSGSFYTRESKPYCKKHLEELSNPVCVGCKRIIRGEYVSALDGVWHQACFVCSKCSRKFLDGKFVEHKGKPYCRSCAPWY